MTSGSRWVARICCLYLERIFKGWWAWVNGGWKLALGNLVSLSRLSLEGPDLRSCPGCLKRAFRDSFWGCAELRTTFRDSTGEGSLLATLEPLGKVCLWGCVWGFSVGSSICTQYLRMFYIEGWWLVPWPGLWNHGVKG